MYLGYVWVVFTLIAIDGKNQLLVADEPVEFEK